MSDFLPIEWPCHSNYGQYPTVNAYNQFIVPNYQYVGEHNYTKVVDSNRNALWIICPYGNERSEDNYFLCLIAPYKSTYTYYLGIIDMKTNICYYLRYDENSKISYYEDYCSFRHKIDIYDDIPIYHEYYYYGSDCYIGVIQSWVNDFLLKNPYLVTKIGDYRICNARAFSPANARALSPAQIPTAIAVIQDEIPVAIVVQLDDDTEDNKIAKLISEYKTKEELENFIMESFTDLSEKNKKLSFDISKIESSIQWNKFFRSVILSVGTYYFGENIKLRFSVNKSTFRIEFYLL
jgi:hypothetical protein